MAELTSSKRHRGLLTVAFALLLCVAQLRAGDEPGAGILIPEGLLDFSQTDTLGLKRIPETETITIFRPGEEDGMYNHGAVLIPFNNSLYAQWQSSEKDEDSPDTHVLFSISRDGRHWAPPRQLINSSAHGAHSSGGWWTDGDTLVAYIVRWSDPDEGVRSACTEYITSPDGGNWSGPAPLRDHDGNILCGVIEQDPHVLPGGRIISAFHEQPGLVLAPFYTDDPLGVSGWTRGQMSNLPYDGDSSREIEPSWFLRPDGTVVMVMRDQASSFRKLASISRDKGASWSAPVSTNVPDSRSKQSAGNLPDGTAYLVGNPTMSRRRYPLVLMLSRDGRVFDRAHLLRAGGADLPPMRMSGRYKRSGFSYPKSIVWKNYLYVAYATNKEDIELTRIPLGNL